MNRFAYWAALAMLTLGSVGCQPTAVPPGASTSDSSSPTAGSATPPEAASTATANVTPSPAAASGTAPAVAADDSAAAAADAGVTPAPQEVAAGEQDTSEAPKMPVTSVSDRSLVGETVGDVGPELNKISLDAAQRNPKLKVREELDRRLWKNEVLAQDHEMTFVDLWDAVRMAKDRLDELGKFPFKQLVVHAPGPVEGLPWQIEKQVTNGDAETLTPESLKARIEQLTAAGYRLEELEFHHGRFDRATETTPAKSGMACVFHVINASKQERMVIRGTLDITWLNELNAAGRPQVDTMVAKDFVILRRIGTPAFVELGKREYVIDEKGVKAPTTTHPIMLHDLNHDGRDEVIVAAFNEVYWNDGHGNFSPAVALCAEPSRLINSGVIGDFTGDGHDDLLLGLKENLPVLYVGDAEGKFDGSPQVITACGEKLRSPTTMTAGDVDGDHDLDVWIGQYRPPYFQGQMPTPYYDANDGFPAYLLLNDGTGQFVEATESAGLAPKRFRRMYSSSLIDLNGDHHLDLICVSDFAGIDVYYNDGKGKFRDVTAEVLPKQDAFGMSHTFGDYNQDGRLDFYVIGMSSTTARRLDYLRLGREDFADRNQHRTEMGYGNRMMLATPDGKFEQAPFNDQIARTGWSWGSTTLDVDNDLDLDIYICNGHMSGRSCKDYCTRYWTQDIYDGNSQTNQQLEQLFAVSLKDLNNLDISWNGFEHNVLWMQDANNTYYNVAFLMGVAFEFDARCALNTDLDGDGKLDLLVEEFNRQKKQHTVHLLKNNWPSDGNHWIGVTLRSAPAGVSPWGATLVCKLADKELLATCSTGHSVWSQHAPRIHWGLGPYDKVESIVIRWPTGQETRLDNPAVGQYHVAPLP